MRTKQTSRTAGIKPEDCGVIKKVSGIRHSRNPAKKIKLESSNLSRSFHFGSPLAWNYPHEHGQYSMILLDRDLGLRKSICLFEENCQHNKLDNSQHEMEFSGSENDSQSGIETPHGELWWSNICTKTKQDIQIRHGDTLEIHDVTNYHKYMAFWTHRNVDGAIKEDYLMLPVQESYDNDVPPGVGVPPDFCDAPEDWFDDIEYIFVHPKWVIPGTYISGLLQKLSQDNPEKEGHIAEFNLDYSTMGRTLNWILEDPSLADEDDYAPILQVPLSEFLQRRKEREQIWKRINSEVLKITLRPLNLPSDVIKHIANFLY